MEMRGSSMESNQMSLAFEDRLFDKREGRGGRIGCTLVTGFLGCGKTTLLQHILKNRGTLQIAVLVNEFGEIDVDSLLLDSSRIHSSHGLSCLSLADGCACCATSQNLKEAIRSAMNSKHNFDYVVIETSGLANPLVIAKELEETGIRLDLVVTVVDVETLDTILQIPVAKQQLGLADLVLINKCDLASLGTISDAEDRVEEATGGTKAIRCRFCSVPLDLVLNVILPEPPEILAATTANTPEGFLSHEAATPNFSRGLSDRGGLRHGEKNTHIDVAKNNQMREPKLRQFASAVVDHEHDMRVTSVAFCSDVPVSLVAFQDFVVSQLRSAKGLLRAKGVVCFEESRWARHFFHFSGKKRCEAVYAGSWESQARTDVVFIGRDRRELESLKVVLSEGTTVSRKHTDTTRLESLQAATTAAEEFSRLVSSDSRFEVHNYSRLESIANGDYAGVQTMVVFGLVGSSFRGIHEGDLNASLMEAVNGRGTIFLSSGSTLKAGGWLQHSFGGNITPEAAWCEIKTAATGVIAKAFRDVCPCRCDMVAQMHSHHDHGEMTQ